jgi:4-amino-4-deoxy-L-arabinose transferase-like glycosyltransferase
MQMPLTATQPKAKARLNVWPAVVVFLIALAVRLVAGAALPLLTDEIWHLLAGHSWIQEGTLRVDQGAYTRAGYFTVLVALFMDAFGETLAVARLPGIIAGAALVAAVFEWLRRRSGMVAAWTGAMLLCFHDLSILLSAEVRFYSLHALCLWLTAAIVYQVTEGDRSQRQPVWMLAIAVALSAVALYVQVTAGVALVALVVWAICDLSYRSGGRLWPLLRSHWILAAAIGAIVLVGAIGMILHPPAALARLYGEYRHSAYWAQPRQDWALFYQYYYSETIALLWGLFPLAFIAALIHRPRAAIFCAFLFVVPMIIMSFGGQKADRYAYFSLPYLFAIWGLAAEAVFPRAVQVGAETCGRVWNLILGPQVRSGVGEQRLRRYSLTIAVILVLAFAAISQVSYRESTKILAKSAIAVLARPAQLLTGPAFEPWASHRSELMRMIERASIFITSKPTTTLLVLGRFDVVLNTNPPDETMDEGEYAIDPRLGRPVIGTVESLQTIMNCYQTGIVIVPGEYWRNKAAVTEEVSDFLMARAKLTRMTAPKTIAPVPPDELLVFEWESDPPSSAAACDELRLKLSSKS